MEEFKKGDRVEVWDFDCQTPQKATYFAYDDMSPYSARHLALPTPNGRHLSSWRHCRHVRPDLEIDAKVWVRMDFNHNWEPMHFAGSWSFAKIGCWCRGGTSHTTAPSAIVYYDQYTLTNPYDPNESKAAK